MTSYYIHINSGALAHYFGRAIILPTSFYNNRVNDLQNIDSSAIILCRRTWSENTDCSLEVVLTKEEEQELTRLSDEFFSFGHPIPISRVKRVHFQREDQAKTTAWNINSGAGFLPLKLINISSVSDENTASIKDLKSTTQNKTHDDIVKNVKYFDHVLGAFAFMRLGGEPETNYPDGYFPSLSNYNYLIKEEYEKKLGSNSLGQAKKYEGLFVKSSGNWGDLISYVYQNVTTEDVEKLAVLEGQRINKKFGVLQLDALDINSNVYYLAVLSIYGNGKSKSTDNLVEELVTGKFPKKKKEAISLIYGLNNGYSNLRNAYKFSNRSKSVKFELDTRLDFYIIESIYQVAIRRKRENSRFSYLDEFLTKRDQAIPKGAFTILDEIVFPKKKPQVFSSEYLEEYLENGNLIGEISVAFRKAITDWMPPFARIEEELANDYFERLIDRPVNASLERLFSQASSDLQLEQNQIKQSLESKFSNERKELLDKISALESELNNLKQGPNPNDVTGNRIIENTPESPPNDKPEQMTEQVSDDKSGMTSLQKLDFNSLKEIARQKGITKMPKTKRDLIIAIKATNTML